jgi:hypothetical protein
MKIFELFDTFRDEPGNEEPRDTDRGGIVSYIQDNCSEFLSVAKDTGLFLYRGLDTMSSSVFVGRPREGREPKGQSKDQYNLLNQIFELAGIQATRANSISCTSDRTFTEEFGKTYYIFPVNGFSYTWSSRVSDIGSDNTLAKVLRAIIRDEPEIDKYFADNFVKEFDFKDDRLDLAMMEHCEVSIHGKYVAVEVGSYIAGVLIRTL